MQSEDGQNKNKPRENPFGLYRLGLDIGVASVGWACLSCDENGDGKHILDLGVRAFDLPEDGKGKSLAAPRREKRALRRRLRRRSHRLERARELLGVQKEAPDEYKGQQRGDVYELRVRALDEKVSEEDFARILLLILKRRGYKANNTRKKDGKKDKEDGAVKAALAENEALMEKSGYRTVGELLYHTCAREENGRRTYEVRNHADYRHCVSREMLERELQQLFAAQRSFGNVAASRETEAAFLDIFTAQRNFDEGPGAGSKYSAAYKVGKCPYHPEEKRIAKAAFSFEYFRMLQAVNHMRIARNGEERPLTEDEREKLIAFCLCQEKVTYAKVRKVLRLEDTALFAGLFYGKVVSKKQRKEKAAAKAKKIADKKVAAGQIDMFAEIAPSQEEISPDTDNEAARESVKETESRAKFSAMPCSKKIGDCLLPEHRDNAALRDVLGEILTAYKSEERLRVALCEKECECLTDDERNALTALSFFGYGHLGRTVVREILPHLRAGLIYSDAMRAAGYDHACQNADTVKTALLDPNDEDYKERFFDITSPAVRRAVSQTVKVLNAVVRKFGSPAAINIELAREMGKTKDERDEIKKADDTRFAANERKMEELRAKTGIVQPSGQQSVKYRLYEEQGGKCLYSGKPLDLDRVLADETYAQVDHVIPYSRCFCDAQYNKVLVLTDENQKKGNATPYEYLGGGDRWEEFVARVQTFYARNPKKREMLLKQKFTVEDGKAWKERTLNDTKYIARWMLNVLQDKLLFADCAMGKKRVTAVNGRITGSGCWCGCGRGCG